MAINREVEKIMRGSADLKIQKLLEFSDKLNSICGACRLAYSEALKTGDWKPYSTLLAIKNQTIAELKEWEK